MKKYTAKDLGLLITAVLTLLFFAVSFWIDDYRDIDVRTKDVKRIEKRLHQLQNDANLFITEHLHHAIDNHAFDSCWTKKLSDKHVSLYILKNDSILYWSDNLPVDIEQLKHIGTAEQYHNIGNGWYVTQATRLGEYKAITFILIRTEYLYQNNFLKNSYNPIFHFAANMIIARAGSDEGELVSGVGGSPLFVITSDVVPGQFKLSTLYRWLAVLMTLLLCVVVFYDWRKWNKRIRPLFYSLITLSGIRLLIFFNQLYFNTGIELFTPTIYAASGFLRSLGDLLLHAIFLYSFILILYHNRNIIKTYTYKLPKYGLYISRAISIAIVSITAWGVNYVAGSLVLNSNISFEAYRISSLSIYSLIAFIIIIFLLAILLLIIQLQAFLFSGKGGKSLFISQIILFIALAFIFNNKQGIVELLFCIVFIVANIFAFYRLEKQKIPFRYFSIIVILFSFYTTALLFIKMSEREQQKREVWAHSLSAERDPAAEMLLRESEESIYKNVYLKQLIVSRYKNEHLLFERLQDQHFKGYFQNYEKQFTICYSGQSLRFTGENKRVDCYKYFETERDLYGVPIPGSSHFWFMNNASGRICYYGEFKFTDPNTNESAYLFINLFLRPETESIGYPELLLEGEVKKNSGMSNIYSYAKYKDGELISQSGTYDHSLNLNLQILRNQGNNYFVVINDYSHYIYKTGNNNVIIISRPKTRLIDVASLFSYNIVILFLGLFILLAIAGFPLGSNLTKLSYKRKITYVLLASITISLTVLTTTVLVFIVRQSDEKNAASIQDKLRSVMIELEQHYVEIHESPKRNRPLTNVLINLSNAFYTDINIYSAKGQLLATSRDEIFEKKLLGGLMNREAYKVMTLDVASKYIHWEQIGNMHYYSAYAPFYDNNRNLVAYLNMPYFFKQSEFREEIMQLIANIINIYILLILFGTIFALFISNQLLRPLSEVQQKMGLLDLTNQPEKIDYRGNDEIGDLVREYNRMIGELAVNAQKLAASERDSAWREMARQIAHEIKNPLTPMQLSIQHVQRLKANNTTGWEDKLDAVAKSLLEQISILSNIASEFSSFARINERELVPVDLLVTLHKSVNLFRVYDNITFEIHDNKEGEKRIMADSEQLQRVFTNLIKNAVQAIGNKPDGIVSISLSENNNLYLLKIEDNGGGIAPQLRNRLFQPNFTTKTSGTGLGLAISKNIVESFGGTIYYQDSELGGACFVIQFPISNIGLELLQELK